VYFFKLILSLGTLVLDSEKHLESYSRPRRFQIHAGSQDALQYLLELRYQESNAFPLKI